MSQSSTSIREQPRFWTQGNYAPVFEELTVDHLEVEGAIPAALDGVYVRNGANPKHSPGDHWFLGHGMLHGVSLRGGRALWYRNRFVRTPLLHRGPAAPPAPPTLTDNASNVALVQHAGRLLSLGEVGLPYELAPEDLSTVGVYDFGGKLGTSMTAHPKLDPDTGEMLFFGYSFAPPHLTFHVADARGMLVRSQPIDLPGPAMMHDFAVTKRHVVFLDLPIVFNLELALAGDALPFRWNDGYGARLGVMARSGEGGVRWFEIDPCFVFHVMNAYENPFEPDRIVLDVARYGKLWHEDNTRFDALPQLVRYRIDLRDERVSAKPLADHPLEFPQIDPRRSGKPYRFGYALGLRASNGDAPGGVSALLKIDHARGALHAHLLHPAQQADEVTFVPAGPRAAEDEGYLLCYLYDQRTELSELVILDAQAMEAPALARIKLPQRVPFGFHGTWSARESTSRAPRGC